MDIDGAGIAVILKSPHLVQQLVAGFVPEDTLGMTSYFKEASLSGLILQFAFTYTDDNRPK